MNLQMNIDSRTNLDNSKTKMSYIYIFFLENSILGHLLFYETDDIFPMKFCGK